MQNSPQICPQCQSPIPTDAPGGLCPACVLLGVAEPTVSASATIGGAPTLEEIAAAFPELEVQELLGLGGMGVVFKARQPRIERAVALKILPPSLAQQPGFAERFTREARALARLNHPHIVAVYDFGDRAGFYYLMMEFVDGVNLRQALRAGVTPEQALRLVPQVCEALQFAHDHGVLHRDIKPENILLDRAGTPKLADFGIAKLADDAPAVTGLTQTGAQLGTAAYMAPEQIEQPATVDHRADIYSLGVVLYEMLTGELPLGRFSAPSEKANVTHGVDEVVMRALEKERDRRQQSATEMKTQVENVRSQPTAPVAPRKSAASFVCSPEHRASMRGQFYICTSKGHLALDATSLTFLSDSEQCHIPLRAIREVGIGHYSGLAKPIRLDFFAVTWDEAGSVRTRLFTPHDSVLSPTWETNGVVAEWADAVRHAAGKIQGRELPFVPSGALGTRKPSLWYFAALFACVGLFGMLPMLVFFLYQRGHYGGLAVIGGLFGLSILMTLIAFFRPKSPRAAANLAPLNPWPKRVFLLIIFLVFVPVLLIAIGLIVPQLAMRNAPRMAPAAVERAAFLAAPPRALVTAERPPFIGELSQGSIELVAIAPQPAGDALGWRMNGDPALEGPFINRNSKSGAGKDERAFDFVFHARGLPPSASGLEWFLESSGSAWGGNPELAGEPGKPMGGYAVISATLARDRKTADFRIGAALAPWHTLAEFAPGNSIASSYNHAGVTWNIVQGTTIESKDGATVVTYSDPEHMGWHQRVVAVTKDGDEVPASFHSRLNEQSEWRFDKVPIESIAQFRFQVRPIEWVLFRGVALAPAKTARPVPGDAFNDAVAQEEEIRLRREQLDAMKQRHAAGIAREIDVAATERDLAIAEARGDAVRIAKAKVRYAETNIRMVQKQNMAGLVEAEYVRAAELELNAARAEETRALRAMNVER